MVCRPGGGRGQIVIEFPRLQDARSPLSWGPPIIIEHGLRDLLDLVDHWHCSIIGDYARVCSNKLDRDRSLSYLVIDLLLIMSNRSDEREDLVRNSCW